MMEKRIKIKSKITIWQFVVLCFIGLLLIWGVGYILFFDDSTTYRTRSQCWEVVGLIFFLIPLIFTQIMSKQEYLSDIYITDNEVKLVYKIRNQITRTKVVQKNNIKKFELNANINVVGTGKQTRTEVSYRFFIDLIEGQDLYINDDSDITLFEGNYKFLYRILDAVPYIPNFKLNLVSDNEIIKAEIDYYKRFGKHIPFTTKFKMEMKKWSVISKMCFLFAILLFSFSVVFSIYNLIPASFVLNSTEKQYISLIDSSQNCNNDYDCAIRELDKAKNLISTDPELYYQYARIYEKKKDYKRAIHYAQIGISYLGNEEVYIKKYKYAKPHSDLYLYQILAHCYHAIEDWEKAIEGYSYVINKNDKHMSSYFGRGQMYFYLKKYDEAKQDFIKYRELMIDDMNFWREHNMSPKYNNKDLTNINEWIKACDAWKK